MRVSGSDRRAAGAASGPPAPHRSSSSRPASRLPSSRLRLTAFSLYDFADSAFATSIVTVLFSQYYAEVVAGGQAGTRILGRAVPGGTLYAWLVGLSMAVVAVAAPFLGALADRRGSRIRFLGLFWLPGVALAFALAGVEAGEWLSGGLLFAAAYACFGLASVFYNALLPELAPPEELGRASGLAWGVGYVGGALVLVLNLLMLRAPQRLGFPAGTFDLGDCFAAAALWWFLFSLPLFAVFRYEDRRPRAAADAFLGWREEAGAVAARVRHTFHRLAGLRNLRLFFLSFLLYNDAVQVVVVMSSIFGRTVLGLGAESLIALFLMVQGTAFLGSLLLGPLADRAGHKPVLLVCVGAWTLTTLWGAGVGIFGAPVREYWILGGISGIFLGGIQSCSRSMLARWVPAGQESELFGFFAIMSRVASVFGPLLYGALNLLTGSLRGATLSVVALFAAGGLLLLRVRPEEVEPERERLAAAPPVAS